MAGKSEKDLPGFSIIIPAYNVERFLARAIQSVQMQTYTNWELILVENGSTDGTSTLCETYLSDQRIRLFHSMKGVSNARNVGIEMATGKWLIFLDADDILLEDTLQKFENADQKYMPDLIVGDNVVRGYKPYYQEKLYYKDTLLDFLALSLKNPTQKCTTKAVAFQNKIIKGQNIRFDRNIAYAEDSIFFLTVFSFARKIVELHTPVYQVTYRKGSTVRSGKKLVLEYLPAIHRVQGIVDRIHPGLRNLQYIFAINQLLVIFVNDIFARKGSWKVQIVEAQKTMEVPEYKEAIEGIELSDLHGIKRALVYMMKKKMMLGLFVAAKIRQAQNKKKEHVYEV